MNPNDPEPIALSSDPEQPLINRALQHLAAGRAFRRTDAEALMNDVMAGKVTTEQLTAVLMALAVRGETVEEITGFAAAMRACSTQIKPKVKGRLTDTCGTGGAPVKTFNISTAAAFIAASAGVPIAKHGNRSITSPSGSADVLVALGADITRSPQHVCTVIEKVGIGFLFAPNFHPAMKHAIPARRALGIRTVFNVLGPLTNPAHVQAQVLGVFDRKLVRPMAEVLAQLGIKEAMVLHGTPGLDELSTMGPTSYAHVQDGQVSDHEFDAAELGIPRATREQVAGRPPRESATAVRRILGGTPPADDAERALIDIIALNAGAAIWIGGQATDLNTGFDKARALVESGAPLDTLGRYVEATGGTWNDE